MSDDQPTGEPQPAEPPPEQTPPAGDSNEAQTYLDQTEMDYMTRDAHPTGSERRSTDAEERTNGEG